MTPKPNLLYKNRLRERSRMTICIGMVAQDGIVIAADAEENDGYVKRPQQKIMSWQTASSGGTHVPAAAVITGAGDAGFIDSFTYELTRKIGEIKDVRHFESYLRETLEKFYKTHVLSFSTINSDYDFGMIVGVYFGFSTSLFVTYKSTVRAGIPYTAVGAGSSYALSMLGNVIDYERVSRSELIAALVITNTKESVPGCGKYTDIVTLHNAIMVEGENGGPSHLKHPDQVISRVPRQKLRCWEESFVNNWLPRQQTIFRELIAEELAETEEIFEQSTSRKKSGRG